MAVLALLSRSLGTGHAAAASAAAAMALPPLLGSVSCFTAPAQGPATVRLACLLHAEHRWETLLMMICRSLVLGHHSSKREKPLCKRTPVACGFVSLNDFVCAPLCLPPPLPSRSCGDWETLPWRIQASAAQIAKRQSSPLQHR